MDFEFTVLLILVAGFILNVSGMSVKCEADHECAYGEFCYVKGFCAKCTECAVYYRKELDYTSCPHSPQECGGCIRGYEEEILHQGNKRDTCSPTKEDPVSHTPYIIAGLVLGAILVVGFAASLMYYKARKDKRKAHNQRGDDVCSEAGGDTTISSSLTVNSHPPPYEVSAPLLDQIVVAHNQPGNGVSGEARGDMTTRSSLTVNSHLPTYEASAPLLDHIVEAHDDGVKTSKAITHSFRYIEDEHQTATVCRNPSVPYNNTEGGPESLSGTISPVTQEDDATNPSSWTPGQNYGDLEEAVGGEEQNINAECSDDLQEESSSPLSITNDNPNDSGVSSRQTSSSSIDRPFAIFGSSASARPSPPLASSVSLSSEDEDEVPHVVSRSRSVDGINSRRLSEEDISSPEPSNKRQRRDSGTHSMGDATTSNTQQLGNTIVNVTVVNMINN